MVEYKNLLSRFENIVFLLHHQCVDRVVYLSPHLHVNACHLFQSQKFELGSFFPVFVKNKSAHFCELVLSFLVGLPCAKKSLVTKLLIKKQSTLAEKCILIQKMYEFHCKKIFFIGIWQIFFFQILL